MTPRYGPAGLLQNSARNPFPKVPRSSCIFWDGRGPFLRHFNFFDFRPTRQKPENDAEITSCYRSLEENSPWDHAQIKERRTWRSIARSRALYNQMAPQLCVFYISAKFDVRPTKPNPTLDFSLLRFILFGFWNHAYLVDLEKSFKMVVSRPLYDQIRP